MHARRMRDVDGGGGGASEGRSAGVEEGEPTSIGSKSATSLAIADAVARWSVSACVTRSLRRRRGACYNCVRQQGTSARGARRGGGEGAGPRPAKADMGFACQTAPDCSPLTESLASPLPSPRALQLRLGSHLHGVQVARVTEASSLRPPPACTHLS